MGGERVTVIGIVYSCFNNYDLLSYVLDNYCSYEDCLVLLIDDGSKEAQFEYGIEIARNSNGKIRIERNRGKGIQDAIDTAFSLLDTSFRWIYFPQQDVYPSEKSFVKDLEQKILDIERISYKGNTVGALGFEIIDHDCRHSLISSLGYLFLSDKRTLFQSSSLFNSVKYTCMKYLGDLFQGNYRYKRFRNTRKWLSDRYYNDYAKVSKTYPKDFPIELPIWVAVCINREQWKKHITVDENIVFHMWFNDVAMQFLSQNVPIMVTRDIKIVNHQSLKEKFGFFRSSADAGRDGRESHVEKYGSHLTFFQSKWGFDYEDVRANFPKDRYKGTLVEKFYNHDPSRPFDL